MNLARVLRCCFGFDVVVAVAIVAGIVAAAVPAMADTATARRSALAASIISLGNAQGAYLLQVSFGGTGDGSVSDDVGLINCQPTFAGNYSNLRHLAAFDLSSIA